MAMILAYLKATNYCNVGCSHCYLPEEVRADRGTMTWGTLRSTATLLKKMAERQNAGSVHVLFHGGEPLMLKPNWFLEAGEHLDEILGHVGGFHTESMQTSLIPYTSRFAEVVHQRFNSHLGSSVDFSQRTIKGSADAYLDKWMEKVDSARNDGIYIEPGMVPTRNEMGKEKEILEWFIDRDFSRFNIDRYNGFGLKFEDRPSNKEHSNFLTALFDEIMTRMARGDKVPEINVVTAVLSGVVDGNPGDRWGGSCQSDFVVIEPDGSTNNCPDKSSFEDAFSNVFDGIDAFSASPLRRKWIRIQAVGHKTSDCAVCENNSWCKSGCPITGNGARDGEDECSGYWNHINHVRKFVSTTDGMSLSLRYLGRQDHV